MRNVISLFLFVLIFAVPAFGKGVFTISPASLNFGAVNMGYTLALPVTITNTGNSILVISSITSSDSQFTYPGNFPIRILEGQSSTITISFTPSAQGLQSGNFVFFHNGTGSNSSYFLSGTGAAPVFTLNPLSLNFSTVNVGSFASLPVTISNTGDASLIISNIISSDLQYTFTSIPFPITIAAGQSIAVDITFTPTGEGSYPADLLFTHNASASPSALPVTGNGHILLSVFNIDPISLNFGTVNVGSSASIPVTISNTGDASLIISNIISSDLQYTFTSIPFPITIAAGQSSVVDVTFTPTGEGSYPGNLLFTHNASASPSALPVTGNGHVLMSVFNIDPISLNFGTVNVGSSSSLPVTISNTGDASLIISDITSSDPQYNFSGTVPFNIDPGSSVQIDITFTPTIEGSYPGNLLFTHNASASPSALPVTGNGHVQMSVFNIDPISLNFGTVNVGSSASLPITISNSGDASLIISDVTSSDPQYTFSSSPLPITILTGQSTVIDIVFAPLAGGVINASLTISHNAAGGYTICDVEGTGSATSFQLAVNVINGWNMVSIPGLHPVNQEVLTWWQGKDPQAHVFTYQGLLVPVQTLVPGKGYWLKNINANTYNTGDEWPAEGINIIPNDPIPGTAGWNMIGGYNNTISANEITTDPPNVIDGSIFSYSIGYQPSDTLNPGKGYWVKLNQAAQIIFPSASTGALSKLPAIDHSWGRIILTDNLGKRYILYAAEGNVDLNNYELPPAPPAGMFDVRFGSQRYVEKLGEEIQSIEFSGMEYPVTVRAENIRIRLQDENGRKINTELKPGEEITMSGSEINMLMVSTAIIPGQYTLDQNYPNPFNPATTIQFTLPEDVENVTLSIYNSLGQKVTELVNGTLQGGHYKYQWDAGNNASGIYICQLVTGKYVSTRKMILLK